MRLLLVNPNSNAATTDAMVAIAADAAPPGTVVEGLTAPEGPPVILEPVALEGAGLVVASLAPAVRAKAPDAVMVAAFGDPGLAALRSQLAVPVVGIGEAAITEAADRGRFAIVTTTPALAGAITALVERLGAGRLFSGVYLTPDDPETLMRDENGLVTALRGACEAALADPRLRALVIGGGPLAVAARRLAGEVPVPIIEPVPAAVRLALRRLGARS
jgi:Asp/Glu/hydantoin racemase